MIVIVVVAPESSVVYQISVVVLFVEFPVDETALVHVAPFCVMLVTLSVVLLRVEITAISVLPVIGTDDNVTEKVVLALVPVFPDAVCILV